MRLKRPLKEIKPILELVKDHLSENYKDDLESTVLFGSFAKGEASIDSDIDIAVILKGKIDKNREREKNMNFVNEILLRFGELVSFRFISTEEIKNSVWPFFYHVRTHGIKL